MPESKVQGLPVEVGPWQRSPQRRVRVHRLPLLRSGSECLSTMLPTDAGGWWFQQNLVAARQPSGHRPLVAQCVALPNAIPRVCVTAGGQTSIQAVRHASCHLRAGASATRDEGTSCTCHLGHAVNAVLYPRDGFCGTQFSSRT